MPKNVMQISLHYKNRLEKSKNLSIKELTFPSILYIINLKYAQMENNSNLYTEQKKMGKTWKKEIK